jgi:parallel beta-helix repeat protein
VALGVLSLPAAATAQDVDDFNVPDIDLAEDPNLQMAPEIPGRVEGTGTYFEVTDSNYVNVTFESVEPVHLTLESAPQMVVMEIEAAEGAASTQITLAGFEPNATYYKYEDNYHNEVAFATDPNGSHTYLQDLAEPHIVFIQAQPSTRFIPSDTEIGDWNPDDRVYTLKTDVSETIQIDEDNLTLDGVGYTVSGGYSAGLYLYGRTGVTIKNVNVQYCNTGILLHTCNNNTLTGNTVKWNQYYGIRLWHSSTHILTGNSMSGNPNNFTIDGKEYSHFDHDIDTTNTVEGQPIYYLVNDVGGTYDSTNAGVFYAIGCDDITIKNQTLANNNYYGVFFWQTHNSTIENVSASTEHGFGIYLLDSNGNTLTGNTVSSNKLSGIYLYDCSGSTLTDNIVSNNGSGIELNRGSGNTLTGNTADYNKGSGIALTWYYSANNILTGNTANSNGSCGIYILHSRTNILTGNTMSANQCNFFVVGSQSYEYDHDIDTTNTVEGKPIYYLVDEVGGTYDSTNAGVFYAIDCSNITIKNQTLASNNYYGVFFWNTHNSTIENVSASNNYYYGIYLVFSSGNTLTGNTANSNRNRHGINLTNSDGNILTNNTANSNSYTGIYLVNSSGNTLTNNTSNSNNYQYGIVLYGSSGNALTGNTANSNELGIYLSRSSTNTLTNNTANLNSRYGTCIAASNHNILAGNTMSGNRWNFRVSSNQSSDFDHYIDTTNTVEDKPIYYIKNAVGEVYDISANGGVFYAINCDNITITDQSLTNNFCGVFFWNTHNSTIENVSASNSYDGIYLYGALGSTLIGNTTSNNENYGIYLEDATGSTLTRNTAAGNGDYGIHLKDADSYTLTDNTASDNEYDGIFLHNVTGSSLTGNRVALNNRFGIRISIADSCTLTGNSVTSNGIYGLYVSGNSSNNLIYNNNFIGNTTQAYVSGGSGNVFNLDAPTGGNYWSDWCPPEHPDNDGDGFVDLPYVFAGGQDSIPWAVQDGWLSPQVRIERLITKVLSLNLQHGIGNSLDAKLDAVLQALDDVNENNDVAAINALGAFINAVEGQRGKEISDADADALIGIAQEIIAMLSGA